MQRLRLRQGRYGRLLGIAGGVLVGEWVGGGACVWCAHYYVGGGRGGGDKAALGGGLI